MMLGCLLVSTACLTRTKFILARGFRSPEEAKGFLQVTQSEPVRVSVFGSESVGMVDLAGYAVIHTLDLKRLMQTMKAHASCSRTP